MPSRREFLAGTAGLVGTATHSVPARADGPPEPTWERRLAPPDRRAFARAVVPAADGFALVGFAGAADRFRGWVCGTDAGGRARWHRVLGPTPTGFLDAVPAAAGAGGVLAAGVTNVTTEPRDPERTDPYVARVDPGGQVGWRRTYQPAVPDGGSAGVVRLGDGYVVAGSGVEDGRPRPWAARLDGSGSRDWTWLGDRAGEVNDAVATGDGVVVGGGARPGEDGAAEPPGSRERAWLAKLTPEGTVAWRWGVDREQGDRVEAVAPRPDGGVVAVGRRGFAADDPGVGWLVAVDAGGALLWERTYPQDAWNWHHDVAPTRDGYVLAGERDEGPDADERGAWLLGVDADGRTDWEYRGDRGTSASAVRTLADGGLLVCGGAESGDSGPGRAWLAKLGGDPAPESGSGGDPGLPTVPGWAAPFLGGVALGGAAAYWRR